MSSQFWNNIYLNKNDDQKSWFEDLPKTSLKLIRELNLPKNSPIIDIGGGDSKLMDFLYEDGYTDLSVLDISAISLKNLRARLDKSHKEVCLIESDILNFKTKRHYTLWHDRATFHFLTTPEQIENYLKTAYESLKQDGYLIVSTFSKSGPEKCSGLDISQYSEIDLKKLFGKYFQNTKCFEETHVTPWGAKQDFVYCGFRKI